MRTKYFSRSLSSPVGHIYLKRYKIAQARIEQLTKLLRSENKAEDGVEEDGEYTVYEI